MNFAKMYASVNEENEAAKILQDRFFLNFLLFEEVLNIIAKYNPL